MSANLLLIVVGAALFLFGLAKLKSSQRGGFNLSNVGVNIGGKSTQTNKVGDVAAAAKGKRPDWIGLAIAAIGLLTALVGWFKG